MVLPIASLFLLLIACRSLHISAQAPIDDASDTKQGITGQRRIDDVSGSYYWNNVINHLPVETNVETASTGHLNGRRNKRAIMSWVLRQCKRIIKHAKLLLSDEDIKIYGKNGDINRALADFRSLKPTNVKSHSFKLGVDIKTGDVGDLRVSLHHVRKDGSALTDEQIVLYLYGPAFKQRGIRYVDKVPH